MTVLAICKLKLRLQIMYADSLVLKNLHAFQFLVPPSIYFKHLKNLENKVLERAMSASVLVKPGDLHKKSRTMGHCNRPETDSIS